MFESKTYEFSCLHQELLYQLRVKTLKLYGTIGLAVFAIPSLVLAFEGMSFDSWICLFAGLFVLIVCALKEKDIDKEFIDNGYMIEVEKQAVNITINMPEHCEQKTNKNKRKR